MRICLLALMLILTSLPPACAATKDIEEETMAKTWRIGFGCADIVPDPESVQPLYISGYNSGREIGGVLDLCQARAVSIAAGETSVLLIGVDCVALDSGTVKIIRGRLADLPGYAVNIYATHTHAGPDTLGLWGPPGVDGKNDAYMERLIDAVESAARRAVGSPKDGALYYGKVQTPDMLYDSRYPHVYDENLYQLRFAPSDGAAGIRMLFYGAHAESLRGENRMLSRDYPGLLCDYIKEETGDDAIFMPGAVGGLIMTREFIPVLTQETARKNLRITAEKLAAYVLSIEEERSLAPDMAFTRASFSVPLDNPVFALYKFLGILSSDTVEGRSATGYHVRSELALLRLDDLTIALIPGEIFPELVCGGEYGRMNPEGINPRPLAGIAAEHGGGELLIIGLANDELGYILPPSDFLLHKESPYFKRIKDKLGGDHYEETNSVGPLCAAAVAQAFEEALLSLKEK